MGTAFEVLTARHDAQSLCGSWTACHDKPPVARVNTFKPTLAADM